MKPRFRRHFGLIWSCVTLRPFACGCGYTVAQAWDEWQRIRAEQEAAA